MTEKNIKTEYRCALYLRVSTDLQAENKEGSLVEQERRLSSYVNSRSKNPDWKIVDVYKEAGRSGKNMERPELQRMLDDIQTGRINCVMTTKLDRLTRSLMDFYVLYQTFEKYDIEFVSIDESFDTSTATGRAMLKITLVFAELERERTSERTRKSLDSRAERGLWNGGQILGYDLDENDRGVLKTNKEEADIVRDIFDKYIEVGSVKGTASAINEKGYRTKEFDSRRGKHQGGRHYNDSHIRNILKNQTYLGKIAHNGQIYEGKHEAIIDVTVFRSAQELLQRNIKCRHNTIIKTEYTFLLSGLLHCTDCGSTMTNHNVKGRNKYYAYYQCSATNHRGAAACIVKRISAPLIEEIVVSAIRDLARKPDFIDKVIAEVNASVQQSIPILSKKKMALAKRRTAIDNDARNILRVIGQTGKTSNVVKAQIKEFDQQLAAIDIEIKTIEDRIRDEEARTVNAEVIKELLRKFDDVWDALTPGEQKELVRLLVDGITYDGKKVRVKLLEGHGIEKVLSEKGTKNNSGGGDASGGNVQKRPSGNNKKDNDNGEISPSCQSTGEFPVNIGKSSDQLTSLSIKRKPGKTAKVHVLPGECTGSPARD